MKKIEAIEGALLRFAFRELKREARIVAKRSKADSRKRI
jgi:hypothetical protein